MSDEVEDSLILLLNKSSKKGRCATPDEIAAIYRRFPGIIPPWYEKLLVKYPICELEIGWQSFEPEDDFDGMAGMVESFLYGKRNVRKPSGY